ncbi:MAG: ATP synthase F0 subunit C [Armatimonadota bacterium]|jgi:F-type H+-transporting ATPase subunit c
MGYLVALAIAAGFALPVAVLSAAIGQGMVGGSAMSAIARQPEAAGKIQLAMIIALALIESLAIYALLVFFLLYGKLPDPMQVFQSLAK